MRDLFDHIVIGGGISGLGMAHFCARRGIRTLVLESGARVGGCIHTWRFPDTGDFWVEAGSHSCFNSYGNLLEILDDLSLTGELVAKRKLRYQLYRGGARKPVLSALHPLELALSLPRLPFASKEGKSVAEYYRTVLGERNYRDLFSPAFSSVLCQPADDFPAELLFRRKPRHREVVRSFTFPDGLGRIPRAIAGQPGLEVELGKEVEAVSRSAGGYVVQCSRGGEYRAPRLTLAVPPDVAGRLLPPEFIPLKNLLDGIPMTEFESLVLAVPREAVALEPLAGLIAVDEPFHSMVSRDYLEDGRYRGFAFHFKPGSGLHHEAQLARCAEVLGIGADRIAGHSPLPNRLPALRAGHGAVVREIDAELEGTGMALTGNYFFGVSIEDCLVRSRSEFERLFA